MSNTPLHSKINRSFKRVRLKGRLRHTQLPLEDALVCLAMPSRQRVGCDTHNFHCFLTLCNHMCSQLSHAPSHLKLQIQLPIEPIRMKPKLSCMIALGTLFLLCSLSPRPCNTEITYQLHSKLVIICMKPYKIRFSPSPIQYSLMSFIWTVDEAC